MQISEEKYKKLPEKYKSYFAKSKNSHISIKPIDLCEWLCKLVTKPGGLVMDLFMGSGSTGIGALRGGFKFVGIELDPQYFDIAKRRIEHWDYKVEVENVIKEHEKKLETEALF